MDFCEGFAIKNLEMLDERKVDREALLQTVTSAFAHQIFVDGCFNADPHPGNSTCPNSSFVGFLKSLNKELAWTVLVQCPPEGEPRAVLLDFGLAKTLTEQERIAFAKLVYGPLHNRSVAHPFLLAASHSKFIGEQ